MKSRLFSAVCACVAVVSFNANAAPVNITGYDVIDTDVSGTGSWAHTYTGTITPTAGSLANYSGGTGTMADGVFSGTSEFNTQLFVSSPGTVSIMLYFDQSYTINTIDIYGGDHGASGNSIPGAITGFDIGLGAVVQSLTTTGFGPVNTSSRQDQQINDRADLVSSGLSNIAVSAITLSDFTATELVGSTGGRFSIAEFVIDGSVAPIPVPAAGWLFGSGLLGMIGITRRKQVT